MNELYLGKPIDYWQELDKQAKKLNVEGLV